jgi:hypothetical protein
MDWLHSDFYPDLRIAFWQLIRTAPENQNMDVVNAANKVMSQKIMIL